MMISSEFRKAVGGMVHSSICTGVILWSCCICATEVVTTSMVNLILYDILELLYEPRSNVHLAQLQISCSVGPRTAVGWKWSQSAYIHWMLLWEHTVAQSETLLGVEKPLINVHVKQWRQSGWSQLRPLPVLVDKRT